MARPETERMFSAVQKLYKLKRSFACPHCSQTIAKPDALDRAADQLRDSVRSYEENEAARKAAMMHTMGLLGVFSSGVGKDMLENPADAFTCPKCGKRLSASRGWAGEYPEARGCALVIAVLLVSAASVTRLLVG